MVARDSSPSNPNLTHFRTSRRANCGSAPLTNSRKFCWQVGEVMAGADHRSWPGDNARCGIGAFVSRCRVTWERFQPTGVFGTLTWLSPLSTPRFSPSYCPISSLLAFESLLLSYFTPYSPSFIASLFLLFYSSPLCPSLFSLCFSSSYLPPPAPGRKMPEAEGDISSLWRYLAQL